MFLYSLLEVSDKTTQTVKWISVGAAVMLLILLFLIGQGKRKKTDGKRLALAGVCVALSFTLALIKFSPFQFGGSITLASFVPILIYAYAYGPMEGFIVGLVHGLLNFIEDPYILTPATFLLDYILPFASVGVMGFFGKMQRKNKGALPIVLGCVCVFTLRFTCHFFSGVIFFLEDLSVSSLAIANAFSYSFIYQCTYIPADALIATLSLVAICKSGALDRLLAHMH